MLVCIYVYTRKRLHIYKISAYLFFKRILIYKEIYISNVLKKYISRNLWKYIRETLFGTVNLLLLLCITVL